MAPNGPLPSECRHHPPNVGIHTVVPPKDSKGDVLEWYESPFKNRVYIVTNGKFGGQAISVRNKRKEIQRKKREEKVEAKREKSRDSSRKLMKDMLVNYSPCRCTQNI